MSVIIRNAHAVTPGHDYGVTSIRIENDIITRIGNNAECGEDDIVVDADGLIALPGFIDIHTHGRSGCDFCDATDGAFDTMGADRLKDGVTGFLATGLTLPEEKLAELCRCAERYKARGKGATCLGVHLEGPFFNKEMAGAQNHAYLKKPDADFVLRLNGISPVKKVSLAPELDGAVECITRLAKAGIVTSGGHSAADCATFERARAAGMTHLTHFCNAMIPIHHLRPSMVTGGLLADDVLVEIICDGVHLSDEMIELIARMKGPDKVMLITDSICAAGCPDGLYTLGGLPVRVADGSARLANVPYDPKSIVSNVAGSIGLYYKCFQRFVRVTGWPLEKAVAATSYNQVRSLGLGNRGELKQGKIADIVLLDEDLVPKKTIVNGKVVYEA